MTLLDETHGRLNYGSLCVQFIAIMTGGLDILSKLLACYILEEISLHELLEFVVHTPQNTKHH